MGHPSFYHYTHVDDASRNASVKEKFAEVTAVQRSGDKLDEFDVMSVGIVDLKASVAVLHGFELVRNLDALAGQVGPHLLGIGGFERYMGQAVHLGIGQLGEHLDVLVVVNLEIGQQKSSTFAGRFIEAEGLLEAQDAATLRAEGRLGKYSRRIGLSDGSWIETVRLMRRGCQGRVTR